MEEIIKTEIEENFLTRELAPFNEIESMILAVEKEYMAIRVKGVDDIEGANLAHEKRMNCVTFRTNVEKLRKNKKAFYLDTGRKIDANAKSVTQLIEPVENHLREQEEIVTKEQERIKQAEEEAYQKMVKSRIDKLLILGCSFNPSSCYYSLDDVSIHQTSLMAITDTEFDDFVSRINLKLETIELKRKEQERQTKEELERQDKIRQEQEAERIRLETIRKEQEEKEHKIKEEQQKIEAEKRAIELEKEREELRKKHEAELIEARKQAEEKAKKDEQERIKKEELEKVEREKQAKLEAERQEQLKPDKEKLTQFANNIINIEFPLLKSQSAKNITVEIQDKLNDIKKFILLKVKTLK